MDDEVEAPVDELEASQEAEDREQDLGDAGSSATYNGDPW